MFKIILTVAALLVFLSPETSLSQCCPEVQCGKPKIKYITKIVEKPTIVVQEKPVIVTQEKSVTVHVPYKVVKVVTKNVSKKNRISLQGGIGPVKLSVTPTEVRLDRGAVIGVQYQRMLGNVMSLGVQVQSNQTVLGSVGFDF